MEENNQTGNVYRHPEDELAAMDHELRLANGRTAAAEAALAAKDETIDVLRRTEAALGTKIIALTADCEKRRLEREQAWSALAIARRERDRLAALLAETETKCGTALKEAWHLLSEARKGLEPFAKIVTAIFAANPDELELVRVNGKAITLGDLRAARTIHAKIDEASHG